MIKVRGFERVKDAPSDIKLPVRGSDGAAGYDFFAPEDIYIPAYGFSKLVQLHVKAYMQQDEYLALVVRSSLATKAEKGYLMISQGTAIIDSDYYSNPSNDGNIGVMFFNRSHQNITISKGERCCQGIFHKYLVADDDISLGKREGGYGSTGER